MLQSSLTRSSVRPANQRSHVCFAKRAKFGVTGFADNSGNVKRDLKTGKVEKEEEPAKPIENFVSDIPKDPWEGEQYDFIGQTSTYFLALVAILAVAVGSFAASRYDDGATFFLQNAPSEEDTAKIIFVDELKK